MTDRSDLVRAVHQAGGGRELARAVAALDAHDMERAASLRAGRELDMGARLAGRRLTPVPLHEHHTAATDWLAEAVTDPGGALECRSAMIAEASAWYGGLDPAVRADPGELGEQARGRARTLASSWASRAPQAEREFLKVVGYLHSEAASGLPQIDQAIDPDNQPAPTPYPTEVFPTFGEEQDPFNATETDNHQSGASSQGAPMLQQVMQQNTSGSGFGSGPERPDLHDTRFDTTDSYAEVPLGPPGVIPAAMPGQGPSAPSTPNPVAGTQQDAGAGRRQATGSWSAQDPFGYQWAMTPEVMHPFHARCGSAHWPDEACGDRSHTASVAIGYQSNLDEARHRAACEAVGIREGLRAVASAASLADLGAHHNRVAQAWGASDRTMDDTAVLHGFMAVVRPVLAERGAAGKCEACRNGDCGACAGTGCTCGPHGRKTAAKGLAAGGGVTQEERESAPHHLPGTDKFPVGSAADVQNAKHDIGRTNEPHDKVVRYINDMARQYHTAPVGG